VLLVTHDRALLDAVATRLIAVEDHGLRSYLGGWADYLAVRRERQQAPVRADGGARSVTAPRKPRREAAPRDTVAGLERRIEAQEQALAALEDELSDPGVWRDAERSASAAARHAELKRELAGLYVRWEERA